MIEKEYTNCNICNIDNTSLLFKSTENITNNKEIYNLVRCNNCSLVYINPRPDKNIINRYYSKDNYYSYQPFKINNKKIKNKLKNLIVEYIGNYPITSKHNKFLSFVVKCISKIFKNEISIIIPYKNNAKVLDIGCGSGKLLDWLKNHNFHVYGVEISDKTSKYGNDLGINIFNGELNDRNFPDNFFDVIIINQVLEHLYSPNNTLKEVYRILKPAGLLIIGVPNINSFSAKIFGKYWSCLEIPRHLYHFSFDTLKLLLNNNGFKINKIIGRTFMYPSCDKKSLLLFKNKHNYAKFLKVWFIIYILKPILYFFSSKKILFSELITFYARK